MDGWVREIGFDSATYGTHTMRRTKASLIYRRTKNIRAVQFLLSHARLEDTARYLGMEIDDGREAAEQTRRSEKLSLPAIAMVVDQNRPSAIAGTD